LARQRKHKLIEERLAQTSGGSGAESLANGLKERDGNAFWNVLPALIACQMVASLGNLTSEYG